MAPLTRGDLTELHCIQPFENIASILERGILSHYRAREVRHVSIADERIQDRRKPVYVPMADGSRRKLHTFANLYVNGRNKMLSRIKYKRGDLGVCVLQISLDVLDLDGVIVSSQNASSDYVRFAPAPEGLALVDKDMVFARSWKHPGDQIAEWRHGSVMCAEVLVPDCLEPEYIDGAYVSCTASRENLRDAVDVDLPVVVNADLFFRS